MTMTDKDAQRRPWVMAKDDHAESFWQGPYRLLAAPPNAFSCTVLTVDRTVRFFDECRECTPEELAEHGLTQPPKPWSERVTQWAIDRNIIGGTTADQQFLKLVEEIGELSTALQKNDMRLLADSIGDVSVVLAIIAAQKKLDYELCQEGAWEEIKDRKGRIINGTFVKEVSK